MQAEPTLLDGQEATELDLSGGRQCLRKRGPSHSKAGRREPFHRVGLALSDGHASTVRISVNQVSEQPPYVKDDQD